MPVCDICKHHPAFVKLRHVGLKVCKECFVTLIKDRVVKEIKRYEMLSHNDTVLVGVSGGKDSLTLLDILAQIHPVEKIIALTIIEGIHGYNRDLEIEEARKVARSYGIEHIVVSIKEVLGYSVDDFMKSQEGMTETVSACTYCGIARRRILNMYARMFGASKVATGHNLDDEVQTYIINFLRGDIVRLLQIHPRSRTYSPKLVKRIKPLRKVYEYETTIYALIKGFQFQETECPYLTQRPTLRAKIRDMLNHVEVFSPGTMMRLLEFFDNVVEKYMSLKQPFKLELPVCVKCGEPTAPGRNICKMCELIDRVIMKRQMM